MPDVDLKYILAVALLDGDVTFKTSHSYERMKDPDVLAIIERITLVGDPELRTAKIKRGGIVEITTRDGTKLREHVECVRGRPGNPMSDKEIEIKCTDLMAPVLGEARTKNTDRSDLESGKSDQYTRSSAITFRPLNLEYSASPCNVLYSHLSGRSF